MERYDFEQSAAWFKKALAVKPNGTVILQNAAYVNAVWVQSHLNTQLRQLGAFLHMVLGCYVGLDEIIHYDTLVLGRWYSRVYITFRVNNIASKGFKVIFKGGLGIKSSSSWYLKL